jgi:effector-binding domain-containing protein
MPTGSQITEPHLVTRDARPYLGIAATVMGQTISGHADRLFPELFAWLAARDIRPAGAPFTKYNVIDMSRGLEIEIAAPVDTAIAGDGRIKASALPAGRYAPLRHFGGFDGLMAATGALPDWISAQGLAGDTDEDGHWAARLEIYHTDPRAEPDKAKWETEISCKVAD